MKDIRSRVAVQLIAIAFSPLLSHAQGLTGTDDRIVLTSPSESFPFTAVGLIHVRTSSGEQLQCTGSLIGPDLLVTAYHCVKGFISGAFFPGYSDIRPPSETKGSEISMTKVILHGRDDKDPSDDWAIVRLAERIGDKNGWFDLYDIRKDTRVLAALRLDDRTAFRYPYPIFHIGYSHDQKGLQTFESFAVGLLASIWSDPEFGRRYVLRSVLDRVRGSSGGPILVWSGMGGDPLSNSEDRLSHLFRYQLIAVVSQHGGKLYSDVPHSQLAKDFRYGKRDTLASRFYDFVTSLRERERFGSYYIPYNGDVETVSGADRSKPKNQTPGEFLRERNSSIYKIAQKQFYADARKIRLDVSAIIWQRLLLGPVRNFRNTGNSAYLHQAAKTLVTEFRPLERIESSLTVMENYMFSEIALDNRLKAGVGFFKQSFTRRQRLDDLNMVRSDFLNPIVGYQFLEFSPNEQLAFSMLCDTYPDSVKTHDFAKEPLSYFTFVITQTSHQDGFYIDQALCDRVLAQGRRPDRILPDNIERLEEAYR